MIDVDLMLEEAEKQKAMHFVMAAGFTNSEIIFMLTRLRESEKDAARYRFIRDSGKFLETGSVFDAIVDQAMKENGDE